LKASRDGEEIVTKRLFLVAGELCNGCRNCEMWCSWVHTQTFGPNRGLIKVAKDSEGAVDLPIINCDGTCPHPMEQGVPLCAEMCPTGTLIYTDSKDAYKKRVELDTKKELQPLFRLIAPWKWPYPWSPYVRRGES
jgi:Fe-S-cluster-containing hydrogenase component 2